MTKRSVTKKPKLTKWFEPHIKPVHVGWYHCGFIDLDPRHDKWAESPINFWFDGTFWRGEKNGEMLNYQNRFWRGLAKNSDV